MLQYHRWVCGTFPATLTTLWNCDNCVILGDEEAAEGELCDVKTSLFKSALRRFNLVQNSSGKNVPDEVVGAVLVLQAYLTLNLSFK